jgi:large subunit ribosomal protein L25
MKQVSMSGSLRENVGKKDAKANRRQGRVPCVLYGGSEQVHFTLDEKQFNRLIFTPEVYLVKLSLEGRNFDAILQDVQYHPVSDMVLHADFLEANPGKMITASVPVEVEGTARGILKGGKLVKKFRKLKVRGLVEDIPDHIPLNLTKLDIGSVIKVQDVKFPKLILLDNPNAEVLGVKATRAVPGQTAAIDEEHETEAPQD